MLTVSDLDTYVSNLDTFLSNLDTFLGNIANVVCMSFQKQNDIA